MVKTVLAREKYMVPAMEVIDLEVEQCFAVSEMSGNGFDYVSEFDYEW